MKTIINEQLQLHNIFQPILRVDQQLHATVDTYEMLMRNAADAFPGIDFLTSLTTTAGNQRWITISQSSLDHVLTGHPRRKIYINIEPCQLGFELAIDDVCAGSNSYAFVARQLGTIRRIKLSLLLFKNEDRATSRHFVDAWLAFATKHHLDFVIEGIADRQIAQQFAGNPTILQQGFYWGKGAAEI